MIKETYERLELDVTEFDVEDVITTSTVQVSPDRYELPGTDFIPYDI